MPKNTSTTKHIEDSGAFVVSFDLFQDKDRKELDEDIEILKKKLIGKMEAELDE